MCLRNRKKVSGTNILHKEASAEVRDERRLQVFNVTVRSIDFIGISWIAIHSLLMMQIQIFVGCPNYFINLNGGHLKEILLIVTSRVGKASVYLLDSICSNNISWHSVQMPEGQILVYYGFFLTMLKKREGHKPKQMFISFSSGGNLAVVELWFIVSFHNISWL